ncbi:DUF6965 family protein [Pedobacter punctiformis]|uniref:DUF6965 domain-containing protein n=1 Tax=Pedobacter punctiformis TaxID=3004097 RepID=A0ABT4LAQ8_9SPHI|nr:hypothetical protein [Pedobacter sp. HCMS5-2]MCZ4244993.1 hypothetical protein [Pedobacter sp. HCMS5-2]
MTIQELEEWFSKAPKPVMPVMLNAATKVNDYEQFLDSHFSPLKAHPTAKINQPLLIRLEMMKLIIESNI